MVVAGLRGVASVSRAISEQVAIEYRSYTLRRIQVQKLFADQPYVSSKSSNVLSGCGFKVCVI